VSGPRVLVLGTGALACYLGGRLVRSGRARVTLAGTWPEGLQALSSAGITGEEDGASWRVPVRAVRLADVREAADLVFVLVKAHQTAAVAPAAARKGGLAVTLQNGWGNRETLAAAGCEVAAGIIVAGATLLGPAHVRAFVGQILVGVPPPGAQAAVDLLRQAGLPADAAPDVERHLWRKLAVNCSINPLTALLGVPNGRLLEDPDARARMVAAAREVGAVAAARGVDLGGDPGEFAVQVATTAALNRSSMLQDVSRGAPTEIDALCGAVSREGRRLGVATPVSDGLRAGGVRGAAARSSGPR
jgi:2-dehydropantoate 2-reductase